MNRTRPERYPIVWLFPVLAFVLLFSIFPIGYNIWVSLRQVLLILPIERFVGLKNYAAVARSPYFWEALWHTLLLAVASAPLIVLISLGVARLLLTPFRGRFIVRSVVMLPWVLPGAISGVLWLWVFQPSWGILNLVLFQLGVIDTYIPWLEKPWLARLAVLVGHVWMQFPFASILLMAALATIDPEVYQASDVDGANAFHQFRYITFPQIKPMIVVVLAYEAIQAITLYDLTYAMTAGGPGTSTTLISYHIYKESFQMLNFGNGAALGFIMVIVTVLLIRTIFTAMPTEIFVEES